MIKNEFWRSYAILFGGGAGLSLLLALGDTLEGALANGIYGVALKVALVVVLYILLWKFDKQKIEPRSANLVMLATIVPVVFNVFCYHGPLDLKIPYKSLILLAVSVVATVLAEELFFRRIGVMLFRKTPDHKITITEATSLVGAYTIMGLFQGFGLNIVMSFAIAVLTLALYLLTDSIDLPLTFHLLISLTTQLYITFSSAPSSTVGTAFPALYLGLAALIFLIGYGIIRDYQLLDSQSEAHYG